MISADGKCVRIEGRYDDILTDICNIIMSCVTAPEIKNDDVLEVIKMGIKAGMEGRDV